MMMEVMVLVRLFLGIFCMAIAAVLSFCRCNGFDEFSTFRNIFLIEFCLVILLLGLYLVVPVIPDAVRILQQG